MPKCQSATLKLKILMAYIHSLDKSSKKLKFPCPGKNCGQRTLSRYINNETLEYFPDPSVGMCDRRDSCGYHLSPRQYYEANGIKHEPSDYQNITPPPPKKPTTYIDFSFVKKAQLRIMSNYFVDYLNSLFKDELTKFLVEKFHLCPSTKWEGSNIFWQIDEQYRARTGKIMLYNKLTGKRVKEPRSLISWVHSEAKWPDFTLEQCFFGLHQITKDLTNTLGIVESEKTAILMTAIYPDLAWLASGGMTLSISKFESLTGRKIILFPDAGIGKGGRGTPFEIWSEIADTLKILGFDISVSNLIENIVTEEQRKKGYDLADYLIKTDSSGLALAEGDYPLMWDISTNNLK